LTSRRGGVAFRYTTTKAESYQQGAAVVLSKVTSLCYILVVTGCTPDQGTDRTLSRPLVQATVSERARMEAWLQSRYPAHAVRGSVSDPITGDVYDCVDIRYQQGKYIPNIELAPGHFVASATPTGTASTGFAKTALPSSVSPLSSPCPMGSIPKRRWTTLDHGDTRTIPNSGGLSFQTCTGSTVTIWTRLF